jgi:hypothetical protein
MLTYTHSNIEALGRTIFKALAEVQNQTGLIGTVLLGGPEPAQGGNITVFEWVSFVFVNLNVALT